jgi:hypothetical protein
MFHFCRSLNRFAFLQSGAGEPNSKNEIFFGRGAEVLATKFRATFKAKPDS